MMRLPGQPITPQPPRKPGLIGLGAGQPMPATPVPVAPAANPVVSALMQRRYAQGGMR